MGGRSGGHLPFPMNLFESGYRTTLPGKKFITVPIPAVLSLAGLWCWPIQQCRLGQETATIISKEFQVTGRYSSILRRCVRAGLGLCYWRLGS
jgi:hypothetical protein